MIRFSWTREKLAAFKLAYAEAVKNGATDFKYCDMQFDVKYAKYLIEYLDGEFEKMLSRMACQNAVGGTLH